MLCWGAPNHRFQIVGNSITGKGDFNCVCGYPCRSGMGLINDEACTPVSLDVPSGKPEIGETNFRPLVVRRLLRLP